jgi:hypothetical protein
MSEESGGGEGPASWTPALEELLRNWHSRVYAAQTAYYDVAEQFRRWNYRLGIPVVVVSSLVGAAVLSDKGSKWLVGSVSILAALLASLQTFLKFGENATLHGAAGDWFAAIRRDIEEVLALPPEARGKPKSCLDSIRKEMNKAGQKSPELSERLWKRVARHYGVGEPPLLPRQEPFESERKRQSESREQDFKPKVRRKSPPSG